MKRKPVTSQKGRLALGLDISTQSLSAVIIDIGNREKVFEHSLDYIIDPRLNIFGIRSEDYIVPTLIDGEANQPPVMFIAALDAIFSDIKSADVSLEDIVVINNSAQQHGHVYLNYYAESIFNMLKRAYLVNADLVTLLKDCFAYDLAPIWMTSNTVKQANYIRKYVGGKQRIIQLSGSDAPLRFTGIVMRRLAEQLPEVYRQTEKIQLLSSFITATLTGNVEAPIDFGNGCGTSLMDYMNRKWSDILIEATSTGLPGGKLALRHKLPPLSRPDSIVGHIAIYFVKKYGFCPDCMIAAGSGDNPQSKVPIAGDLLSLGTSSVNMVSTDGKTLDIDGYANAMYDGIGRPFLFGCRTNGAMVWDHVRAMYGMEKEEYEPAEEALQQTPLARYMVFWQPRNESFPPSGSFDLVRISHEEQSLGSDYAGIIETTLAAMYIHSRHFTKETSKPLHVTGGATNSEGIMRRVAAIWNRPVIRTEKGGAAMGAAVAGAYTYLKWNNETTDVEELSTSLMQRQEPIYPRPEEVSAYHKKGGYLKQMALEEKKLVKAHAL